MTQADASTVAADPGDTETIPAGESDSWGNVDLGDLDVDNGLPEYLVIHGTLHDSSAVVSIADDDGGGNGYSSFGGVTVSGPGATWDTSGDIRVGQNYYAGSVTLTVADQASAAWSNLYLGGILALDDTATIAGTITSLAGVLEAIAAPGGGAGQTVTISNDIALSVGGNEEETDDGTGLRTAAGTRLVVDGTISGAPGYGSLAIQGDVTLAHADNSFSGGTSIDSGRLELAASGAAGTGEIDFEHDSYYGDGTTGLTLVIDPAAVTTGALSNLLGGFVKGDTIDMTDASVDSVKVDSNNRLLINEGGSTVTLSFTERDNLTNAKFKLTSDGHGGTDITLVQVSSRDLYWARPVDGGFEQAGDWLYNGQTTTAVPYGETVATFDTGVTTPYTVSGDGGAAELRVIGDAVNFSGSHSVSGLDDSAIDFGLLQVDLRVDHDGQVTVAPGASIIGTHDIEIAVAAGKAGGSLTVEGRVSDLSIDLGAYGKLTVSGAHAVLQTDEIWSNSNSSVAAKDGGQIQISELNLDATLTLTGAGSALIFAGDPMGYTSGRVTIEKGAALDGGNIVVYSGPVTITGVGSIWKSDELSFSGLGNDTIADYRVTIADHATLSSPSMVGVGEPWTLALDATASLSVGGLAFEGGILEALDEIGQSSSPGVVVDVAISLDGHVTFESEAGTSLTLDGLISGDGTGSALVVGAGKVALGHADNSYGGTILAGGTLVLEAAGAAGAGGIEFLRGASSRLDIAAGAVPTNDIQHFSVGNAIQLLTTTETGFDFEENTSHTRGTLVVDLKDGSSDSLTFDGDFTKADFTVQSDMVDGAAATEITTDEPPCFLAGTRILTARGDVAVEHLAVGDHVLTEAGRAAPVRWIGRSRFDLTRLRAPAHFRPIRIRQGAISEGLPRRDLLVSRGHGIFLQDVLIPALYLLNGATIVEDGRFESVTYYHVELDRHDILLAEGVAAESYLDTGNRQLFESGALLDPVPGEIAGCAPVVQGGEALLRVRAALQARIPHASYLATRDPDLHLDMDGVALRPVLRDGRAYRFTVDRAPRRLRMMSRANVSDRIGESPDMRMSGVATSRIALRAPGLTRAIDLADPALGPGFSWVERGADGAVFRWTDGAAALPAALWQDVDAFELEVEVAHGVSYWA